MDKWVLRSFCYRFKIQKEVKGEIHKKNERAVRQAIPWQVDVTTMPKGIKLSGSTKTNLSIKLITVGNVRKVNGIADPEANQE